MFDELISQFQGKLKFAPDFKKTVAFVVKDHDDTALSLIVPNALHLLAKAKTRPM
jgi:hypothetical protein